MTDKTKNIIATACLAMLCWCVKAQTGQFFNNERQLSSNFVTQVYVDRDGFLWATTRDGINRYDGYQFHVFKRENPADSTLASNYVNSITQDSKGIYYFGMYGSLQTWDGNRFRNVTMRDLQGNVSHCYASCFLQRRNGDMLAGTSGAGVMHITDTENARQLGGPLASLHTVRTMLEDRQQHLWMVTGGNGLVCYDGEKTTAYLAGRSDLYGLCEDKLGNIYVGTSSNGVFRQQGETFVHLEGTGSRSVSALFCDKKGNVIIGYDGNGVAIYDPKTGTLTDNPFFCLEVDLSKGKVLSVTEDDNGNLWLALLEKGLYKQPTTNHGFHYMGYKLGARNIIGTAFVVSILIDNQGRKWIGTDRDGIYIISADSKEVRHLATGFPAVVMGLAEDDRGRIWVGSYQEGFGWVDPDNLQYHRQPCDADDHLIVMDLEADTHGRLWMATMAHGLMCMNLADGTFHEYRMAENADNDRQVNSIANDYVSQLQLSPDGRRVYVSTSMGTCCLDIETGSWTKAFGSNCLNYSQAVRVTKELQGQLWVATSDGLFQYATDGKLLRHYSHDNGLTDNAVASIEQDNRGCLWLGTNHGLNCLDPATGTIEKYYVDDGLQGNEFGDNSSCLKPDGTIIMGGTGGLTWFHPADITHTPWQAGVHITDFMAGGMQVNTETRSGGHLVTDTTVIASNHFRLGYHDNTFAIQLSTLSFDNPEHTTFLYSINDEPFVRMRPGENIITLSHMPPGNYSFRVKAERNGQVTPERTFTVSVGSPWYRTWWAYLLYAALLAFILWQYLTLRRRKEQDRLRLQERIHAEEMADAKLRFFVNMSHEIRTPMTLIVTPLLSLIKGEQDPQRRATYETIRRNARRILGIINQMMDLQKIDKGQMQMRMRETDLVAFVADIHTLFLHQAAARHIDFSFSHDADRVPVWIDQKNFDKVIVNILSNAFKFTPTGGTITIRLTHDAQQASIAISDSGEKIPEDKLERIFERFYQSPSQVNDRNSGTGIGLDLSRSLVELHHGTISARNLEQGCQFTVTLPLGNAHLKPEEMLTESDSESDNMADLLAEEPLPEVATEKEETRHSTGKKSIVIAEDDDEIRRFLTAELGRDYDVKACINGREALGMVYRTPPDLVLSDVMMPEMDGNALCSRLKSNTATSHIPIILLTAKSRDEDLLEGLDTGADAYLVKPFNIDILRRTIVNLIASRQQLRLKYERNDQLEQQVKQVESQKSPDDKLLERVMATINNHLDDSELSVDLVADEVGISRVHLHRKMKELTGQTPHDFIRNLRLKRAATLLAQGSMNVNEVMYACGFANSTSFSTIFKKFYGLSPRDFMKEHGK